MRARICTVEQVSSCARYFGALGLFLLLAIGSPRQAAACSYCSTFLGSCCGDVGQASCAGFGIESGCNYDCKDGLHYDSSSATCQPNCSYCTTTLGTCCGDAGQPSCAGLGGAGCNFACKDGLRYDVGSAVCKPFSSTCAYCQSSVGDNCCGDVGQPSCAGTGQQASGTCNFDCKSGLHYDSSTAHCEPACSYCTTTLGTCCGDAGQPSCAGLGGAGCNFACKDGLRYDVGSAVCAAFNSNCTYCQSSVGDNCCGGLGDLSCAGTGQQTSGGACNFECNDGLSLILGRCAVRNCGKEGQRACCIEEGAACDSGLVQVPGCDESTGSCECSSGIASALGTCVKPTACGGKGQRACCVGNFEYAANGPTLISPCDDGLIALNGCAGDCTCGGAVGTGLPPALLSTQTCTVMETIPEPDVNATLASGLPSGPECPAAPALCGYADLHVHMFAHLAHGGATVAGTPYDPSGGVNTALGEDYGTKNPLVKGADNTLLNVVDGTSGLPQCPDYLLNSPLGNLCQGQYLFHGDHTPIDTTTYGGTNDSTASNLGAPAFNGWPQWTSTIHQQVYYKWLERAWRGGLRLMVMDAVTNEALCKTSYRMQKFDGTNPTDCTNSMVEIDAQLNAAKDFQTWLDNQYGGPGQGWFQIVTTPQQTTNVIQQGKLAVVLGIEVEHLFNCHSGADTGTAFENTVYPFEPTQDPPATISTCTPEYVQQQVQHYYSMGVRHIFPIHNFDNAYGSPAAWQDSINIGNEMGENHYWDTENCYSDNYGFWLDALGEATKIPIVNLLLGFNLSFPPSYPASTDSAPWATCNSGGLTALGNTLINALMDAGMIIDVDHMSRHSLDGTLSIASDRNYAGIAATHVQFFDLYTQTYADNFGRHERMRTLAQLQHLKNLGGLIAVMLKDDVQDTEKGYCLPNAVCFGGASGEGGKYTQTYNGPANNYGLNNNCRYSTTEWAQAYMYGADTMGGPVGMGSDFNGIAGHVGPRFGSAACGGSGEERSAQEKTGNRLVYPFTLQGFGTFDKQVSGQRTFDFNTDGLAHIGLLPDMVADLKNVGLTDTQLQPLFSSAQAYINMWSAVAPPATAMCAGDCSGDHHVTVDEILTMVSMALGDGGSCPDGLAAGATPDISLILQAVNNALNNCPA